MAVLIVFDIADAVTYRRAQEWMEHVRDHAKGYDKVLVVGNKKDLEQQREVSYEEANNQCMEYGFNFLETSAKSGDNMDTLRKWLHAHARNKIQEHEHNDDWQNERIRLDTPQSVQADTRKKSKACCDV